MIARRQRVLPALILCAGWFVLDSCAGRTNAVPTGEPEAAATIGAVPAPAAKETALFDVPVVGVSGDRVRYALTSTHRNGAGESTATTEVTIAVVKAEKSGRLISWTYGDWHAGQGLDSENERLINLLRRAQLVLRFRPKAPEPELINREEIQAKIDLSLEALRIQKTREGMSPMEAERFILSLGTVFQNRDRLKAFFLKEPSRFFALSGKRIPVEEPVDYEMELPNFLGGEPFPGRGRLLVKNYDPANHRALVGVVGQLDPDRMRKIRKQLGRDIAAQIMASLNLPRLEAALGIDPVSVAGAEFLGEFYVDTTAEYDFDLTSGWLNSLNCKTVSKIKPTAARGFSVEETLSMTRILGDKDP